MRKRATGFPVAGLFLGLGGRCGRFFGGLFAFQIGRATAAFCDGFELLSHKIRGVYRFFFGFMQVKVAMRGSFWFPMPMKFRLLLLVALAVSLSACAPYSRHRAPQLPIYPPEQPECFMEVGQVTLVNREAGFVMIRTAAELPAGMELLVHNRNNVQTAVLRVSPEKQPSFMIADILKGRPLPGETAIRRVE